MVSAHYVQPIVVEILGVFDDIEDTGEGNEENIEEVKASFITMNGNLGIKKKKKVNEK